MSAAASTADGGHQPATGRHRADAEQPHSAESGGGSREAEAGHAHPSLPAGSESEPAGRCGTQRRGEEEEATPGALCEFFVSTCV